jgi:hypothetical protein
MREHDYDDLSIGSRFGGNPGVNPSLTILALAERAMSFIPQRAVHQDRAPKRAAVSVSVAMAAAVSAPPG